MKSSFPDRTNGADDDKILCACTNFTIGNLREIVEGGLDSFDALLEKSGAGRACTACLLDLEYYASNLQELGETHSGRATSNANADRGTPFRHKIYRAIDRLGPLLPFPMRDFMPVIAGPGLRQRLIVANDSLSYEGRVCAPQMHAEVLVRDAEGVIRHRQAYDIAPDSELDLSLSEFLPATETGKLRAGSVELRRRAATPGFRGTTRPQILLEAPNGSCAVHGQDSSNPGDVWFTFYARAHVDRFFFYILNNTSQALEYEIAYPYDAISADTAFVEEHAISVPSHGARIHEFLLPQEVRAELSGRLLRTRLSNHQPGGRKVFLLCASHDLQRFSIDHASN